MTAPVPRPKLSFWSLAAVQSAVILGLALIASAIFGIQQGASFAVGMLIMFANLLLLAWVWSRVLAKKPFAMTTAIIVVKYTVLLIAVIFLTRETWFHVLGAGLGMAAFIASALIQATAAKWE